jgi:hypothetical protein
MTITIVETENATLSFGVEPNTEDEHTNFLTEIKKYQAIRHGSSIQFLDKTSDQLILSFNPFDNTVFIHQLTGIALSKLLGTKRFLVGAAKKISNEAAEASNAIHFPRDRSFRIHKSKSEHKDLPADIHIATYTQLQTIKRQNLLQEMVDLFKNCADFTPGKQKEYTKDELIDKFCRFNPDSQQALNGVKTQHVFLLDGDNKIVGTISMNITKSKESHSAEIYLYDEIVDYRHLLNSREKESLESLQNQLQQLQQPLKPKGNSQSITAVEESIAAIVEPKRKPLLKKLFSAASDVLSSEVADCKTSDAFIRVAEGRESLYETLGCVQHNTNNFVIHGGPTVYAEQIRAHIKHHAQQILLEQQKTLGPKPVRSDFFISHDREKLGALGKKLFTSAMGFSK